MFLQTKEEYYVLFFYPTHYLEGKQPANETQNVSFQTKMDSFLYHGCF